MSTQRKRATLTEQRLLELVDLGLGDVGVVRRRINELGERFHIRTLCTSPDDQQTVALEAVANGRLDMRRSACGEELLATIQLRCIAEGGLNIET